MHRRSRSDEKQPAAPRLDGDTLVGLALAALGQPAAELAATLGTTVARAIECECRPELMSFDERVRLFDALERRSRRVADPAVLQLTNELRRALWPHAPSAARPDEAPDTKGDERRESA